MPLIWQLSATHFGNKTLLRGVLVRNMPPLYSGQTGSIKNLFQLLGSYFVPLFSNEEIKIEVHGKRIKSKTDEDGAFSLELDFLVNDTILIYTEESEYMLESVQQHPIIFPELNGLYEVISDIDDTIIVSYSSNFFKRISTVAFKGPHRRTAIDYTKQLFKFLSTKESRVFYISKSESNLLGMIVSFLSTNQLPKGDIFLTPYLKFRQLFITKKGEKYKEDWIGYIVKKSNKKIILIGDDGQKDMQVYLKVAQEFPNRIFKIYIRKTNSTQSNHQLKQWGNLKATGIDVIYFDRNDAFNHLSYI